MMPEVKEAALPTVTLLGEIGEAARGTLGEKITDERAQEIADAIPGFMVAVAAGEPEGCFDGRKGAHLLNGQPTSPRYKMAGGNLQTFYVAQRLAGGGHYLRTIRAENPNATIKQEKQEYQDSVKLRALHQKIGAHTSDHAEGENSDCGAADKEPITIQNLVESNSTDEDLFVAPTAAFMRVPFDEKFHKEVVIPEATDYLEDLKREGWVGRDLLDIVEHPKPYDVVETPAGEAAVEVLAGLHKEELFVVNRSEKTLDRDNFPYDVFWCDEGRIWAEAHEDGIDEDEAIKLYQAAMTFNIATALTLGGPQLRVAIVE